MSTYTLYVSDLSVMGPEFLIEEDKIDRKRSDSPVNMKKVKFIIAWGFFFLEFSFSKYSINQDMI